MRSDKVIKLGRVIELGEFTPASNSTLTFRSAGLSALLENIGSDDGLLITMGSKSEIILTTYDEIDPASPIIQNFVLGKVSCTEKKGETKTWYSYDERGRVIIRAQQLPTLGVKILEYKYDPNGNIMEVAYQRGNIDEFYHVYEYDLDTRLKKVYTSIDAPVYDTDGTLINKNLLTQQVEYQYYLHGPLKREVLANNLQGIDYTYTVEGWLKSINHYDPTKDPGKDGDDVFGTTLEYYNGDYLRAGTGISSLNNTNVPEYFNGNIKAMAWFTTKPSGVTVSSIPTSYVYTFDSKYQLTGGSWGTIDQNTNSFLSAGNIYKEDNLAYDLNGNILSLRRFGQNGNAAIHDFTQYQYYNPNNGTNAYTNMIKSIDGYNTNYTYNSIGQLRIVTQSNTNTFASFNPYGLIKGLFEHNDDTDPLVKYFYDDNGLRYKKETYNKSTNLLDYTTYYVRDASGDIIALYDNNGDVGNNQDPSDDLVKKETYIYGSGRLGIHFERSNASLYELKDHLGNIRATITSLGNQALVQSFSDYYPYGMVIRERNSISSNQYRFGFQGEFAEHDLETDTDGDGQGWNAFQFRMYDPVIGRWLSVDPKNQYYSPYVGMGNDPVNRIDSDGGDDIHTFSSNNKTQHVVETNGNDRYFIDEKLVTNWPDEPDGSWNRNQPFKIYNSYEEFWKANPEALYVLPMRNMGYIEPYVEPEPLINIYGNIQIKKTFNSKKYPGGKTVVPFGYSVSNTGNRWLTPADSYVSYKYSDYFEGRVTPLRGEGFTRLGDNADVRGYVGPSYFKGVLKVQGEYGVDRTNGSYAGIRGVVEKKISPSVSVEVSVGARVRVLYRVLLFNGLGTKGF